MTKIYKLQRQNNYINYNNNKITDNIILGCVMTSISFGQKQIEIIYITFLLYK